MAEHRSFLRHLLMHRHEWVEQRVLEYAKLNGYQQVTTSMNRLFGHLGSRPLGLSELARRMLVTRQAVHKLALDAEKLGLVEFVPSETDRRVMLLRFSQTGWVMADRAAADFAALEAELAQHIGSAALDALKRVLAQPWSTDEAAAHNPSKS